jgi:hypothetical protein
VLEATDELVEETADPGGVVVVVVEPGGAVVDVVEGSAVGEVVEAPVGRVVTVRGTTRGRVVVVVAAGVTTTGAYTGAGTGAGRTRS